MSSIFDDVVHQTGLERIVNEFASDDDRRARGLYSGEKDGKREGRHGLDRLREPEVYGRKAL